MKNSGRNDHRLIRPVTKQFDCSLSHVAQSIMKLAESFEYTPCRGSTMIVSIYPRVEYVGYGLQNANEFFKNFNLESDFNLIQKDKVS